MIERTLSMALFLVAAALPVCAQQAQPQTYYGDPMANISVEMTRISKNVETLSEHLKEFVDKFEKIGGTTFSEKQQRLVLGMELLVRAEARVATLQKFQIELVEKQGETRAKLAAAEQEIRPERIERAMTYEGTTRTDEMRESRRTLLQAERVSLSALLNQIRSNLEEVNDALRDAQSMAYRLRRTYLPQIEREVFSQ